MPSQNTNEAVLDDEFLTEVPVVVECFRAFLPCRKVPFIYYIAEFAYHWVVACLVANLLKLYK